MVKTMHTINANSVAEKTRAAMKFGRFFLGNLWDSYLGV